MRKLLLHTLLILLFAAAPASGLRAETFFQLPIIPDSMAFGNRVNYLVEHYWDFCDLKKAFSSRQRMSDAFKEYLDLMPLADADKATAAVDKFVKALEKQPNDLLFITGVAEDYMYSDTAALSGDAIYLQFVKAVTANKKIDKASKMRYERQQRLLENCQIGRRVPDFTYIDRGGEKRSFDADTADIVYLYVYDTDCADCSLARVRLDADINTTKLIDAGSLRIVAISPTTPDGEWRDRVASYPKTWSVGALEDFDDIYEVKQIPTFFIMDKSHKLYFKNLGLDQVLGVSLQLASRTRDPYIQRGTHTDGATEPEPTDTTQTEQ